MIDANEAVRAALRARLAARRELIGIEGLTARIPSRALPRIFVETPESGDWGTKDSRGREVRTAASITVAAGQELRLPALAAAAEAAGEALGGTIGGWHVASAVLIRTRTIDRRDGTRTALIEHRIRVLEI